MANPPNWLNEVIGGWALSGITTWHSGVAFGTNSNAFVAGYSNDAPALFNGDRVGVQAHVHKTASGQLNLFSDPARAQADFTGPVGFTIGSRNNLRGPKFFDQDFGLAKTFPVVSDRVKLKFRADAFNALNHPNFALPSFTSPPETFDITGGTFGQLTSMASIPGGNTGYRVIQFALRLEF
jgi:hypothetical protein